jgi:hypothetical protein
LGTGYTIPGPNGAGGVLKYASGCQFTCDSFGHATYISAKRGKYGTEFRVLATGPQNSFALGEPLGAVWGTVTGKSTKSAGIFLTFDADPSTLFTATDRYMLFRFEGGGLKHAFYGWARMQITYDLDVRGSVILVDWAYDPTGVHIPAGYHGGGQVDPQELSADAHSAIEASGLRALWRGAPGLRHWRAARAAAATGAK